MVKIGVMARVRRNTCDKVLLFTLSTFPNLEYIIASEECKDLLEYVNQMLISQPL